MTLKTLSVDASDVIWRERGSIALPVAGVSFCAFLYYFAGTPVESLTIWTPALLVAVFILAAIVLRTSPSWSSGGGDSGVAGGCGSDGGGCAGGDGGSC